MFNPDIDIEAFVRSIIVRSATLEERVASYLAGDKFQETAASQARLGRWEEQYSLVGKAAFHDRIAALGLSPADLPRVLGVQRTQRSVPTPAWAELLGAILEGILDPDGCKLAASRLAEHLSGDLPAPFIELYWPVVRHASRLLKQIAKARYSQLSDHAHAALEAYLLTRLQQAGRQVAQLQFAVFQTVSRLDFPPDDPHEGTSSGRSTKDFVGSVPGKRLLRFFDDYPVHARHCAVLAGDWIDVAERFLIRFTQDRAQLEARFNRGYRLGVIAGLRAGLSDPHRGGESVWSLAFSGGCKIVYKPRSLAAEQQFSELLGSAGDLKSFRHFQVPQIWDRGQYGWMEFIRAAPCRNLAGVRRYYWRAGALLGLFHLARGVDCHRENLIACGEYPILIDADALWHLQNPPQPSSRNRGGISGHPLVDTVLRTGCLPGGSISENRLYAASALESHLGEHPVAPGNCWPGSALTRFSHLPSVGVSPVAATRYKTAILAGFRWIGKTIVLDAERRVSLLRALERINESPRRHLHRSTAVYTTKLKEGCHPALLKEGIDFSLALKIPLTTPTEAEIDAQETRSLEQLDVPYLFQPPADAPSARSPLLPLAADYFSQIAVIETALQKR